MRKSYPLFWGKREIRLLNHFALEALDNILNANFLFIKLYETTYSESEENIIHYLYGETSEKHVRSYKAYKIPCRVEYNVGEAAAENVSMRSVRKLILHIPRVVLKQFDYFPSPGDLILAESSRWYEIVNVVTDEQFFMSAFDVDDEFSFSIKVEAVEASQSKYQDIEIDVSTEPPAFNVVSINIELNYPEITVSDITI